VLITENLLDVRKNGPSIRELIDEVGALSNSLIDRVNTIDQGVQALGLLTNSLIDRVNTIDQGVQALDLVSKDLGARLDKNWSDLNTLESRIRANPFRNTLSNFVSSRDGSSTMGFTSGSSGQYIDFVEVFRPTFEDLLSQLSYLQTWLAVSGVAVDLGAGRGEMVQVMKNHGLLAFGIDIDESVVSAAVKRGIDVRLSDIDTFLDSCEPLSLDVVTAIQVVEHVNTDQLVFWFEKIHSLLKPGGVFIAETPNPHAIDAFKAFWVDVTHVRPYYPESLLSMAQSAGFSRAEIWAPGEQDNITDRLEFAGSYTLIATA
jgi:2-polyprenyl-3-methyl-5-hydroxy-6-metoxy-1,4-benzoquinol methylase